MGVVELSFSFAVLCAALSKADRTLHNLNPECKAAAFISDDKYFTCDFDSSIEADITTCLGSSVSDALSAGASVQWCLLNNRDIPTPICFNSSLADNYPSLNISEKGILHIDLITEIMRRNDNTNLVNCSFVSRQGVVCQPHVVLELFIFSPANSASNSKPESTMTSPSLGLNLTLCVSGTADGYRSSRWTLDSVSVDTLNISDTQPSPNISNYVSPVCSRCSCHDKYLATRSVQEQMERNLSQFGYAAFVITYYSIDSGDDRLSRIGHLCSRSDRFLTIFIIKEVSGRPRTMDIKFFITDAENQENSTPFQVNASYYQLPGGVFIHPFPEQAWLQPGTNAAFICNATTAGDSIATMEWSGAALLPEADVEANDRIAVSNLTEDEVERFCEGISGAYYLPLRSMFGRDPEVESGGPVVLLHYSALLICNAEPSLTNSYFCHAINTSSPAEVVLILLVSSGKNTLIGILVSTMVAVLVLFCLVVVALMVCVVRYRSLKDAPVLMVPHGHPSFTRHIASSSNPLFEEEDAHFEFSRDNLYFLNVLGEGQFGQVLKATAEGICPQDLNRSVVAVKTLKPNASWSDKVDLQSELNIMLHIEPHRNIINFLGMCSETDTEPLFILMEFAMYGSVKDYLKNLVTGKSSSLHPLQVQSCSCSCHTNNFPASLSDRTRSHTQQNVNRHADATLVQAPPLTESRPHPIPATSQSPKDVDLDLNAAAHAARLLCLLDSNFSQYDSKITGIEYPNDVEEELDSTCGTSVVSNSSECYAGRCAYHSCVHSCMDKYVNTNSRKARANSYQNHRECTGIKSEPLSPETPSSAAPLLSQPPYINVPNQAEDVSEDCTCRYLYDPAYQNSGNDPSGKVASASCHYCSLCGSKTAAKACQNCTCCDVNGRSSKGKLGYFEVLDCARQISRGMEHLDKMKYVHRDLAARNVLIAESFLLKIGDFGLARDLSGEDYYRKISPGKIPARWMAVESLVENKHTSKSDVWSYGVVLWEILTYGLLPYGRTAVASSIESLACHVSSGQRLHKPDTCTPQMYEIMKRCWDHTPEQRPSFTQLADAFSTMLDRSPDQLNRNIEEVPLHPEISALEADVFSSLLPLHPVSSPEQLALTSDTAPTSITMPHLRADIQEVLVSPTMPILLKSGPSSTDRGCFVLEQSQSPPNSRGRMETRRVCAPPYPLCNVQRTEQTFPSDRGQVEGKDSLHKQGGNTLSSHLPNRSQLEANFPSSCEGQELEQCDHYSSLLVKSDGPQAPEALAQQGIIPMVKHANSIEFDV